MDDGSWYHGYLCGRSKMDACSRAAQRHVTNLLELTINVGWRGAGSLSYLQHSSRRRPGRLRTVPLPAHNANFDLGSCVTVHSDTLLSAPHRDYVLSAGAPKSRSGQMPVANRQPLIRLICLDDSSCVHTGTVRTECFTTSSPVSYASRYCSAQ